MKKISFLTILCLSLIGFGIGTIATGPRANAQAAQNANGQALEIAPPVVNVSANPGETVSAQLSLRDISDGSLVVNNQINDFVASGEDGTPKILLDETEPNPFSLKNWIEPLPQLTLKSREIQKLPVTIDVPSNAAPGGYYGVVRFTATAPEMDQQGVALSASLGALVLLTVKGDVKEAMSVEQFSVTDTKGKVGNLFESTPIQFEERLKNSGNIHEEPHGQVVITDMFGKTVAAVNVNLPPRNVLPRSIRKFTQTLDSSVIGNKKLFGLYHAKLALAYGAKGQTLQSETTFWIIPYRLIGGAILAIVIGFFVLRVMIRRYNQSIIRKAQGGSKTKKKRK